MYDPGLRFEVSSFRPTIAKDEIRERLLEFIRRELSAFIHEDRIQTAAGEITIGYGGGFPVEMVLDRLLEITISKGVDESVHRFEELKDNGRGTYIFASLLNGIRVDQETEIFEGVRLVPLPSSEDRFPSFLSELPDFSGKFLSAKDFESKTLVIVDFGVSPMLVNPNLYPWNGRDESPFQHSSENDLATSFSGDTFCHALSMACNAPIQPLVWWRQFDDDQMYNVTGRSIDAPTKSIQADRISSSVPATRTEIDEAVLIYKKLANFRSRQLKSLSVSLNRWIKSKADGIQVDRMIDLGIAFESLFLSDSNPNRGEITYRFCLRGAHYLSESNEGRRAMFTEFKSIYDARSQAVHTGELQAPTKIHGRCVPEHQFVRHAQDLCLMALKKVIDSGRFPDWHHVVLGD